MQRPLLISDSQSQFNSCLSLPGYKLICFLTTKQRNFFPHSPSPPQFFEHNLVSPCRTIRQLPNTSQGALRAFYYQLLKVCFELELYQSRGVLQHFKSRVFNADFKIDVGEGMQEGNDRMLGEGQCKKALAEFLQMLASEIYPNCEEAVNRYPLIDAILVQALRNMLTNDKSIENIFGQLADQFGLCVTLIGDCFKFEDSDIFCYAPTNQEYIYLTFMDGNTVQQSLSNGIELPSMLDPIEERFGSESGTKNTGGSTPQFEVYSLSQIDSMDEVLRSNGKQYSPSQLYTPEPRAPKGAFHKKLFQVGQDIEIPEFNQSRFASQTSLSPSKLDKSFQRMKQQLDDRMKSTATRLTSSSSIAPYNPYTPSSLQYIPQYQCNPYQYQYGAEGGRGDYYEDFTKTFLLEAIEEPFRSNIRSIKNGIRGLRKPVASSLNSARSLH